MNGAAVLKTSPATTPRRLLAEIDPRPRLEAVPSTLTTKEQQLPAWLEPTVRRVNELLRLPKGWDSYGANAIRSEAAYAMVKLLTEVMCCDSPLPSIVPSPEGHLQAEWHTKGIDLEVEVVAPLQILVRFESPTTAWEDILTNDVTSLVKAVDALS
jgi:hypothetical protein